VETNGYQVKKWRLLKTALVAMCFGALLVVPVRTAPGTQGQWRTLSYLLPPNLNPVHVALMHNGKVLMVAGSGNDPTNFDFEVGVWNPQTDVLVMMPVGWDMFCNDMSVLPDGRVLINSGTLTYDPFHGTTRSSIYDPATGAFTDPPNMAHGRWYPTLTTLGDGRVMTFSGLTETGGTNSTVEIYTPGGGWSPEYPAGWTPPLYPRQHLLPNGKVLYSGLGTGTRTFDPATQSWSGVIANTIYSGSRTYGSSVLLPLSPADGYKARVMIFGGGNPATATTEVMDTSVPSPTWQAGPSMSQPRIELNATILPNRKVLVVGGSANDEDAATASLNADLFDTTTSPISVTSAGSNVYPRLYHSNALLLPDARVLLVGGNPVRGSFEQHIEIYSPAYLFNPDGSVAIRPTISAVSSPSLTYGGTFQIQTPDAAAINSVVMVRPGTPTHAFDNEQRLVELSYTVASGALNVTAPPNGNIAPPGYYLLFVLNAAGVPSVGTFVQLPVGQAPAAADFAIAVAPSSATIGHPGDTNFTVTISGTAGFSGAVSFSVTGLPKFANARFSPSSVTGSGTSTMTVSTNKNAVRGTSTLTVTGTSGGLVHSANVTLNIQ
jgi:hypothetical protein